MFAVFFLFSPFGSNRNKSFPIFHHLLEVGKKPKKWHAVVTRFSIPERLCHLFKFYNHCCLLLLPSPRMSHARCFFMLAVVLSCFCCCCCVSTGKQKKKTSQERSRDNRGHKTHPRIHPIPPHGSSPLHCSLCAPSQQLAVEDFPRKQRRETLGRTSNVNKVKLNQQTQLVLLCRSESDYKLPHTHTQRVWEGAMENSDGNGATIEINKK